MSNDALADETVVDYSLFSPGNPKQEIASAHVIEYPEQDPTKLGIDVFVNQPHRRAAYWINLDDNRIAAMHFSTICDALKVIINIANRKF